ncbi:MAG: RNA polymerase sigma factor [Terriglobales bacterium]
MGQLIFNEEYVRKLAEHDPVVQRHFIEFFGSVLRVKLRAKLRSPQLVEDARQETFLRVFQAVQKGDGAIRNPGSLPAFVNAICNNVVFESLRGATRHSQMPEDLREMIDDGADPLRIVVTDERKRLVRRVLDEMAPKDRDLLRQVYFDERDKSEISQAMKINTEYLRVLIHRARNRFRDLAEKDERRQPPAH